MDNCLLCNFTQNADTVFYENKSFYAKYDIHPISPGHTLVFPKRHVVHLLDLHDNEWVDLKDALTKSTEIISTTDKQKLYSEMLNQSYGPKMTQYIRRILQHPAAVNNKPDAFNYGNNDGTAAGRTINHLHIHIIPRYVGDVENPVGGIRNIIPGRGQY
jgi:diadenosine tetraphosphate (Ap4A) HIT family hydrolase